ncbi:MAG: transposase [Thermodesulfovibrionales bacterium]
MPKRLNDFKSRELPQDVFAVFIDCYHTEVKDNLKIKKACVYMVLGIDLQGRKDGRILYLLSERKHMNFYNSLI